MLTFNFSHNGIGEYLEQFSELEKFAVNTYSRELADLALVLEHVATQPELTGLPVYLVGHSRGAGVSLVYALDHPEQVAGVISWNGVTNLDLFTADKKKKCVRMAAAMSLTDEQASRCHWTWHSGRPGQA